MLERAMVGPSQCACEPLSGTAGPVLGQMAPDWPVLCYSQLRLAGRSSLGLRLAGWGRSVMAADW